MLRVAVGFLLLAALLSAVDMARAEVALFREVLTLADGRIVVVEENTLEPRSVGSYNVRLYGGRDPRFPYDDFVAGILVPRDGTIESANLLDTPDGTLLNQQTSFPFEVVIGDDHSTGSSRFRPRAG